LLRRFDFEWIFFGVQTGEDFEPGGSSSAADQAEDFVVSPLAAQRPSSY